ncbi:hypothetical protein Lal_00014689 [Lupinus albus]|nr:hypothetical protein Lal_00014689 [Lupinus albus]
MERRCQRNFYAAGYLLNPHCFLNVEEFEKHKFKTCGLLDVFEMHAHRDLDLLDRVTILGISLERERCRLGESGSLEGVKYWAILKDSRLSDKILA